MYETTNIIMEIISYTFLIAVGIFLVVSYKHKLKVLLPILIVVIVSCYFCPRIVFIIIGWLIVIDITGHVIWEIFKFFAKSKKTIKEI